MTPGKLCGVVEIPFGRGTGEGQIGTGDGVCVTERDFVRRDDGRD